MPRALITGVTGQDRSFLCGDATKAKRAFGWWPGVTLDDLIERMVRADVRLAETEKGCSRGY